MYKQNILICTTENNNINYKILPKMLLHEFKNDNFCLPLKPI